MHCGSCKQVRKFAYLKQHFPLGTILHPPISPVLWFIILELFLLLFIPCIQKSRKLFDCNEHILCAQYHGKSYFLHFSEADWDHAQGRRTQIPSKQQDMRVKHNTRTLGGGQKSRTEKSIFSYCSNRFGMEPFPVTSLSVFSCNQALCTDVKSCAEGVSYLSLYENVIGHPCHDNVLLKWH